MSNDDARLHGHGGGVEERMSQYRKKPIVIEAHQWFKNGDHPDDHCPPDLELTKAWPDRDDYVLNVEGKIVRRYRHPSLSGDTLCKYCRNPFHVHGWIDGARNGGAECTVCPGDWIIRGVNGEVYPCKPDIFETTYEALASNPEPEQDPKRAFDLYGICIAYEQGFGHAHRDLVNPYAKDADMHAAYDIGKQRGMDTSSPEPEDAEVREAVEWWRASRRVLDFDIWQRVNLIVEALLRSQAGQGRVVTADEADNIAYRWMRWNESVPAEPLPVDLGMKAEALEIIRRVEGRAAQEPREP